MSVWILRAGLGLILVAASSTAVWLAAASSPNPGAKGIPEERLKPAWKVGDQWEIETVTQPLQARTDFGANPEPAKPDPVRWRFTVQKLDKLGSNQCFVVEIVSLPDPKSQPRTLLWVDAKALALRQMQTQLPIPGGFTTVTESYQFGDGQPAPVMGMLTALPVELPMFVAGKSGGKQTFSYDAFSGPAGKRAPSDVGFAVDITQSVEPVKLDQVKGLVPPDYTRDLQVKPLARVTLETPEREVSQIWQASQPWPVYSNNGSTTARLVKVTPAK
jgi:hypothetical protein